MYERQNWISPETYKEEAIRREARERKRTGKEMKDKRLSRDFLFSCTGKYHKNITKGTPLSPVLAQIRLFSPIYYALISGIHFSNIYSRMYKVV